MSTYATQTDVEDYVEGWVTDDPQALERLIQRAEYDVDILLRPRRVELPPTQVVTLVDATTGTFTITFSGDTTVAISFPPAGYLLEDALEALPSINSDVTVYGSNPFTIQWNNNWASKFTNHNVPLISVDATNLDGHSVKVNLVAGRRIDTLQDVTANELIALKRAVCAQVEYRLTMGEDFFRRAQWNSVSGPEFNTQGKLPTVGPKVFDELSGTDLIQRGARATLSTSKTAQRVYQPVGGTPIPDDWRPI